MVVFAANPLVSEIGSAVYGAIGALLVAAAIKMIQNFLDRDKEKFKENFLLRKELREELAEVKKELYALQEEIDEWKQKYYAQVELTNSLKLDVLKLTEELEEYKKNTGNYTTLPDIAPRAD
jgi:predicted nuclease with TOPRIM domain